MKLETAICQSCGFESVIVNAPKREKSGLETVLSFIERQQKAREERKKERLKQIAEEEERTNKMIKKYWWIYAFVLGIMFAFLILMSILENNSII